MVIHTAGRVLFFYWRIVLKLSKDVSNFMNWCCSERANSYHDRVSIDMFSACHDLNITSPIEQILYFALDTIADLNYISKAEPVEIGNSCVIRGLDIEYQHKTGKYRCDFLVTYHSENTKSVIVECDSQSFHERTLQERKYEKERDRFLIKHDYKVFHFTGSEIVREPMKVASEILSYVTNMPMEDMLQNYNI